LTLVQKVALAIERDRTGGGAAAIQAKENGAQDSQVVPQARDDCWVAGMLIAGLLDCGTAELPYWT
jgi:hypothetical protein